MKKHPMFDLSIIIPTRNRADALLKAIMAIERSTHAAHEIIVVDGASTDATHGVLLLASSIMGTRLRVIREGANVGFAAACNKGFALAGGRYACVLHDDVHPLDGALDAAINQMDESGDDDLILALPWDGAPLSSAAASHSAGGEKFSTTHLHGTHVAEFPFARTATFAALPFDAGYRSTAATLEFSVRGWTNGFTIAAAKKSALRSHIEAEWEDLTGRAEREAVIARAGLPIKVSRFDARSPCTLQRKAARKAA